MPTELCGELHPTLPGVACDKPQPCWTRHANVKHHLNWAGRQLPSRRPRVDIVEIALKSGEGMRRQ